MAALRTNDQYDHLFDYYGQIYNVDPALVKTAFHLESAGNPNTRPSSAGALGGMQMMPALAKHYGIDPHDMTQAIPAATAYLAEGLQATGGNPAGALAYYNGGPKTLERWLPETQGYVAKAHDYYPQMRITNLAGPLPASEDKPPIVMADASGDVDHFKNRWGLSDAASPPKQNSDVEQFQSRWGLTPGSAPSASPATSASGPTPAASRPMIASDAAMRAPDNLGDTELTTAQMAAQRAQAANVEKTGYASLEPSQPGAMHLLWSAGQPFAQIGEIARGLRPIPQGVNALATAAPLAGAGDIRFDNPLTVFPRRAKPDTSKASAAANAAAERGAASEGNPLQAGIPEPAPSFEPQAGRSFEVDAMGNVTQSGLPVPAGRASPAEPANNPLASTAPATPATVPVNPLSASSGEVATQGPIVPGSKQIPLSPTEEAGYAAIRAPEPPPDAPPPTGASAPPPGAPPGTPPQGEPGYAHTTPGVSPAGLSPTEAAGYAAIHDEPPPAPMIPPLTKASAQKVADNLIRYFHAGKEVQTDIPVPEGYHPTLTGLTNDPGLATLHRGVESVSAAPAVVAQRNAQAINSAAHALQGDIGDAANMEAGVKAQTGPLFENAFANKTDMDPSKVQAAIKAADDILAGKNGIRPGVKKYVTEVRDGMLSPDGNRAPVSDPERFHGVQLLINDHLSPIAQNTDADKQAAAASLMKLKPLVQSAIESGAPGFKVANDTHAQLMRPVDEQKFLEGLNLTNATGDVRLQAVDSAIKNIQKQQNLPGVPKAKWVTPDKLNQLVALRNALRMEAARGTGKPINSTTFQNLATNSKVAEIAGSPLASRILGQVASPGLIGFALGEGASKLTASQLAKSEAMVKEAVLERLLNFSGKGEATLKAPTPAIGPRASRPGPGAPWNPLSSGP